MTHSQALLSRCGLAVAASGSCVLALSLEKLRSMPRPAFDRWFRLGFAGSRFGLFALVFFVLRIAPRGDLNIYGEEAAKAAQGQLIYRDFPSSYAPLHPYLDVALGGANHGPLGIILFAILCECALVFVWLEMGRAFLSEAEVRGAALLFATSAVSLQFVTIDGQNNVLVALLATLGILLLACSRELLSGLAVGVSIALVKFLPLLYVPVFVTQSLRRRRWAAGFLLGCVPVYAACAWARLPFLSALTREGNFRTSGNVTFFVKSVLGVNVPGRLADALVLLVLAGIVVWIARTPQRGSASVRLRAVTFGIAALTLALVLFSKKSWPPYLVLAWFPICLAVPLRRWSVFAFAAFNVVAIAEPSVWAVVFWMPTAAEMHQRLRTAPIEAIAFFALEALLLAGYGWLLGCTIKQIRGGLNHEAGATHATGRTG